MLAEAADQAFTRDGWLFELKLDGYRIIASKWAGEALLLTRNGNDFTHVFPEIARAVAALPLESFILDGEVVALDADGKPSFARLQRRGTLHSHAEILKAAAELPVTFYAFDLIALDDNDVRPLPLSERKRLLRAVIPTPGVVRVLDHIEREGEAFLAQVTAIGLEGIIAKKADAPYRSGRTADCLKIKTDNSDDFVIVGFTRPKGVRTHLGALQLADYVDGALVYAGRVGSGFTDKLLTELHALLGPITRADPPCHGPWYTDEPTYLTSAQIPETKTTTWVEPVHVCHVRFREWTPDGLLRHATLLRIRSDKRPHECERQGWRVPPRDAESAVAPVAAAPNEPTPASDAAPRKTIAFSNLNKIYWPSERYTKGDMIEYYRAVSPWLLPYLRDRPLVLTRFPDGIDGKSFYQKDAPEFVPEWIRTVGIWSEETQREIQYFVCDDEASLLYIANMGTIPLHIWASRVETLDRCDWCVLDLDPKDAPFSDVVRCALTLHRLCESVELPNYVKTTGKTGLHILLPLGRQCTYDQSRTLGELLARVALRELSDIATITRHVTRRGDKVYLDYLQNIRGQTIVAPFSVRPLPGATVSMPLLWDEVNESLDPKVYTIKTAIERMERLQADPCRPALELTPDLGDVLRRLAGKLGAKPPSS